MSLLITKTNSTQPGVRKKTLSKRIELGAVSMIVITIIMICTLSLAYLAHSNKIATRAYQLRNLEKERQILITENEFLNMKLSQAQSLATIEEDPKVTSMIRLTAPVFIRGDTAVASNPTTSNVN